MNQTGSLVYFNPQTGAGLELNDLVNFKVEHLDGFGIGELEHYATAVPLGQGELLHGTRMRTKVVGVDFDIIATSLADLFAKRRQVIAAFNPLLVNVDAGKVGKLRYQQSQDAPAYQFDCILAEQLPLPTTQHVGHYSARFQARFRSVNKPTLYTPTMRSMVYTTPTGVGFGFPLSFPIQFGGSGIFVTPTLAYDGDAPTPVVIDLEGPAVDPRFINVTTDRTVAFLNPAAPTVLAAGQHLVLDTDPDNLGVWLQGVSRMDLLSQHEYWTLAPGANELLFDVGGTDSNTRVTISWYDQYLGL